MKTYTFWTGKGVEITNFFTDAVEGYMELHPAIELYRTKGNKSFWIKDEWPPKKIRITVEEIK